ncbi:putative transcriptional regulators (plasmid) [Rubrobacter radiotolerans]|uniref:MerR family DNA-binding transcriptional regulator n=1 Tax=Rubrobacter radiotolerans TaxID=42256 RepID=A0A023X7J0_RUBRA|nr:MerR family DNA-binding transcriptional regulator [Rubrobacter radiotolerans]AHY48171.1 putative transcriptional regulators [Rubrobacter radiotolerans]MDX5895430.1 MerR family DNA-binding transcriptional regulator [Rubrobacter radiotolerans]SMC01804.1 DNA-binding transcriptional regulator, MerR family [Rubrobacter radiotolerans DSM 5868]
MGHTIGELADEFDVTPRAIRFYEERGLLSPSRQGTTRMYGPRDRARLKLVLRGKRLGFGLEEIREMLDLYTVEEGDAIQLRHCLEVGREKIAALERQKQDIEATLEELRGFEKQFVRLLEEKGPVD